MQDFGTYTIKSFLPPAVPLKININQGWEYVRITNKAPLALVVDLGNGNIIQFPEMYLEDLPLPNTFTGWITITPRVDLTNTSQSISGIVTVGAWQKGELVHPQAQPLTQQAVNTTASGKPLFVAFFGVSSSAGNNQSVNIFNPANSGVVATIHSAKGYTNSPGVPTLNLIYLSGADLNFSGTSSAVSQQGSLNPPVSVMHVTTDDSNSAFGGQAFEVGRQPGATTQGTIDLKVFPDNATLYPGGNMRVSLADTTNGHVVEVALKWVEDQIVPPVLVTGATAVASQIDSELLTLGTNLIKSVVPGPLTTYSITNDGVGVHSVDQGGVLHQVEKYNSAGNPLQLGQASDVVEILGSLLIDALITVLNNNGYSQQNSTGSPFKILNLDGSNVLQLSNNTGANNINLNVNSVQVGHVGTDGIHIDAAGTAFRMLAGSLSRVVTVGDTTIANAGTSVAHSLGVVPDFVIPVHDLGAANADVIGINFGTMTSSNFTAYSSNAGGSGNVRFIVIKLSG